MKRTFLAAVFGALSFTGLVYAGDPAPVDPSSPVAPSAPATPAVSATDEAKPAAAPSPEKAEKAEAPKAATPFHVMMGWLAKQVAPTLENPCPATADGEKAWRAWFAGGNDVPAASLRDAFVAEGFTADKFVGFFQEMVAKHKGDCAAGKCSEGKCADGKCSEGKCQDCKGAAAKADTAATPAVPASLPTAVPASGATTKPATSDGKPSCGGCPSKQKDAAKPAEPTTPKP